jgi:hypothetical protein
MANIDPQLTAAFSAAPTIAAAPQLATAAAPTYTATAAAGGMDPMEEQRRHFAYMTGELETLYADPAPAAAAQVAAERSLPTGEGGGGFDLDQLITTAQEQLFVLRRIEQAGLS